MLPGFVGRDASGRTSVLGRGGSDLTAVFLARELEGSCRLVKDVDGLYTADPASSGCPAVRHGVLGDSPASGGRRDPAQGDPLRP